MPYYVVVTDCITDTLPGTCAGTHVAPMRHLRAFGSPGAANCYRLTNSPDRSPNRYAVMWRNVPLVVGCDDEFPIEEWCWPGIPATSGNWGVVRPEHRRMTWAEYGEVLPSPDNPDEDDEDEPEPGDCFHCGGTCDEDADWEGRYTCEREGGSAFYCDGCGEHHDGQRRGYQGQRYDALIFEAFDEHYCEEYYYDHYDTCGECGTAVGQGELMYDDDCSYCSYCWEDHNPRRVPFTPPTDGRTCMNLLTEERVTVTEARRLQADGVPVFIAESVELLLVAA